MAEPQLDPFDSDGKVTYLARETRGSGEPPDGGKLEARVDKLEDDMKELKADMKALRLDVAEIKGMMKTMPTTLQLIGFAIAVFVAAGVFRFFGN